MELGWWPQLGLAFLQLLLISSLPRGTVSSSFQGPLVARCLPPGGWGVPRVGAAGICGDGGGEGAASSHTLEDLVGGAGVPAALPENVTWFCHLNLWG